jgi:glutaredoxin
MVVKQVIIYSRHGCHLCESARAELERIRSEIEFNLEETFIDTDAKLESEYGLMVPVVLIDGRMHGYGRIERERFKAAILA